jgi:transposase
MEKYYPAAVHRKAEKLEQMLLRIEAGEPMAEVCQALGLKLTPKRVEQLQAKYEAGGRQRAVLLDGRYGHDQHVNSAIRAYLTERKQVDTSLTAGALAAEVAEKYGVQISEGHLNHVLREVALTRPPGRPRQNERPAPAAQPAPPQANAGLFFPGRGEGGAGGDGDR